MRMKQAMYTVTSHFELEHVINKIGQAILIYKNKILLNFKGDFLVIPYPLRAWVKKWKIFMRLINVRHYSTDIFITIDCDKPYSKQKILCLLKNVHYYFGSSILIDENEKFLPPKIRFCRISDLCF